MDSLLEIIESMKIESKFLFKIDLKKSDSITYKKMVEVLEKSVDEKARLNAKLIALQDQLNIMNNSLIEIEGSKYFKYSMLYTD